MRERKQINSTPETSYVCLWSCSPIFFPDCLKKRKTDYYKVDIPQSVRIYTSRCEFTPVSRQFLEQRICLECKGH